MGQFGKIGSKYVDIIVGGRQGKTRCSEVTLFVQGDLIEHEPNMTFVAEQSDDFTSVVGKDSRRREEFVKDLQVDGDAIGPARMFRELVGRLGGEVCIWGRRRTHLV